MTKERKNGRSSKRKDLTEQRYLDALEGGQLTA